MNCKRLYGMERIEAKIKALMAENARLRMAIFAFADAHRNAARAWQQEQETIKPLFEIAAEITKEAK